MTEQDEFPVSSQYMKLHCHACKTDGVVREKDLVDTMHGHRLAMCGNRNYTVRLLTEDELEELVGMKNHMKTESGEP